MHSIAFKRDLFRISIPASKGHNMVKRLLTTAILLIAMLYTAVANSADIRPFISGSGSYRAIVIEGIIEKGDFETFIRIAKENQGEVSNVHIFSPGGDFYEAMKIGRAMRALELSSLVPARGPDGRPDCEYGPLGLKPKDPHNCTCASAGFFIHIGAIHRGGKYIAVHRPYFAKGEFGNLSQGDAQKAFDALQASARTYMQEMGVPKHIQEDVLGTPSERALVLDEKTVKTYFWGALPYLHEWSKNRCSILSEAENQRVEEYYRRFSLAKSVRELDLLKAERNDIAGLLEKQDEERDCALKTGRQSRIEAYTRYFGVKPNDYAEQNFLKWSDSVKYLGRQFYDLQDEERFDEEKFAGSYFLKRPATANAPAIILSDSYGRPKVVTWVSIVSTSNPSQEYTQRLLKSLESAWGKQSGGNGASKWIWDKKEFSAKLTYEPTSAQGPYLSLVIKPK